MALNALECRRLSIDDVLRSPPDALASCALWDVLLHTPKVGRISARRVCEDSRVWPLTPLHELSYREAVRIIRCLPKRALF